MNGGKQQVILTIDDESFIRDSFRNYLEDYGYKVLEAPDGKVGLELFAEHRPDLVLVDLRMPEVDGLEVLEEVTREAPGTPVIVVSGTGVIGDAIQALRLGAWDYLLKPLDDLILLKHAIENALERARLSKLDKQYQQDLEQEVSLKTRELRQVVDELVKARDEAESASRAKTEFLANMSHEIRTPLNGILGMLQLLKAGNLEKQQLKYVEIALKSARGLLAVMSDVLNLSHVESGAVSLHNTEFNPSEVVQSVLGAFGPEATVKGVLLRHELDPAMPRAVVTDEGRLRQVLFNLVGNALKFTEHGEILVTVTPLPHPDSQGRIRLLFEISDTGIGIPGDKIEEVFLPFSQADGSMTRKFGGAGLGLAIVRRLVDLLGGNIVLESEPGVGTTLHFTILAGAAQDAPVPVAEARKKNPSLNVLVVEDDQENRLTIELFLRHLGHTAHSASNGREALEALAQGGYNCVLMDIQMPVMNGMETTTAIRTSTVPGIPKDIPIIALTAYAMEGDRERFLAAGMNDYLGKPIDLDELDTTLARVTSA